MHTHRELIAWQRAHAVAIGVVHYSRRHWTPELSAIFNQVRRASLSAQLNIAEGFASGRGRRCKNLLRIAYGSAVETTDLLDLLIELRAPNAVELQALRSLSTETQALTLRLWKKAATHA